jgi:hypothetical protein
MDPAVATVIVATIAASASIVTAFIAGGQRRAIRETHHQVSVNHHSSPTPTVLDRLEDVADAVERVERAHTDHIRWHLSE